MRPDLLASRPGLESWPAPPVRDNMPQGASPPASLRRISDGPWRFLWTAAGFFRARAARKEVALESLARGPGPRAARDVAATKEPCRFLFRIILSCTEGVSLRQKDRNRKTQARICAKARVPVGGAFGAEGAQERERERERAWGKDGRVRGEGGREDFIRGRPRPV